MKSGTVGDCGSSGCHSQCRSTASSCYSWIEGQGYLDGTSNPPLVQDGVSCLTIFGGNMPRDGSTSAQWKTDILAWAAAGAQNN